MTDKNNEDWEYGLNLERLYGKSDGESVILGEGDFSYKVSGTNWGTLPEGWVYKDSNNSNGYSYIWECRGDNGSGNHVLIADQTDNGLYMYWDSTDRYRAGSQWTNDTWHHWAVVRSGTGTNNMKFYWNGAYITQWSSNSAFAISA